MQTEKLDSDEEEGLILDTRENSALVEEQLLTFYSKQLEHSSKQRSVPRRPSLPVENLPIHKPHAYPCADTHVPLPSPPSKWPQQPIMLRPSPRSYTRIRGIRKASLTEYQRFAGFCAGCILPVNTGKESDGESLVIDFETTHFCGTLLMRIKNAPPIMSGSSGDGSSYFDRRKRRFQAVVKGRFKTPLKMSECVTGQLFERPAGALPAKWIVTTFIKFVSILAPQLEATIDGDEPRFLTPLVATAHTVLEKPANMQQSSSDSHMLGTHTDDRLYNYLVYAGASSEIENGIEEPCADDECSVMRHVPGFDNNKKEASVSKRQKLRKKAYNHNFAHHAPSPCFQLDKEYTFEFFQHLIVFDDTLALDMGRPIGKVDLAPVTDGQPIKFMSAHKDCETGKLDMLWSFDIWHETLYPYAEIAAQEEDQ